MTTHTRPVSLSIKIRDGHYGRRDRCVTANPTVIERRDGLLCLQAADEAEAFKVAYAYRFSAKVEIMRGPDQEWLVAVRKGKKLSP